MTRILFFGDVVGKSGRKKLFGLVDNIVSKLKVDFTIVNAENSAHGFGINPNIAEKFFLHRIDVLTTGDHIWDQMTIKPYLQQENRIVRPYNYNKFNDGLGAHIYTSANNKRILVINLLGRLFIDRENLSSPFTAADEILAKYKLGVNVDAIFVDFHAEATSEKMSMANYLDGRVSAVIGTHTHIPTSDGHILPSGTAFQSDAGMCGDFDSSIGMKKDLSLDRFVHPEIIVRLSPAESEATICGVIIDVDDKTGLSTHIEPIIIGPHLHNTHSI